MSSNSERTYIMVKPDGVNRALCSEIMRRFEQRGFKLIACKLTQANEQLLRTHYAHLVEKSFFTSLLKFMMSGPVFCMVWEGKDACATGRKILGETNPLASMPGTIRGDYGLDTGRNICHGSDSVASAEKEISLWFPEGVIQWERALDSLIYE